MIDISICSMVMLYILSFVLSVIGVDAPAWYLFNLNLLIGIFASIPYWVKSKNYLLGGFSLYLKLSLVIYVCFNSWFFQYNSKLIYSCIYIFWLFPLFLFGVAIFEKLIVKTYFTK